MKITTRLTSFFLGMLAVVLLGFAGAMYAVAHHYLHEQLVNRLSGGLETLVNSVDVHPEGVEWEKADRAWTFGQEVSPDQARWLVADDQGREVERSKNLAIEILPSFQVAQQSPLQSDQRLVFPNGDRWRIRQTRIVATPTAKDAISTGDTVPSSDVTASKFPPVLILSVGVSLEPTETLLRNLASVLIVVSIGLWCFSAIVGRWLCKRALLPVTSMAEAARQMSPDDWQTRLPPPGTNDEVADLAGAFNGLLNRLQDSYERQRRFTGDASHQLRTPLTGMLGQIDVALLRDRSAEEYRTALTNVQSQGIRLREVMESLLFLARADSESLEPPLTPIELRSWLQERIALWQDHPRFADIAIDRVEGDMGQLSVRTHSGFLTQILDNLLDNAAKYSLAHTPIHVGLAAEPDGVLLFVQDAGSGIEPADVPHIFEPFFRAASVRLLGVPGTGLGLAVSRRMVAVLGGEIKVASIATGGTRFTVSLPTSRATITNERPINS